MSDGESTGLGRESAAEWVDLHGDLLFRFALKRVGDRETAEDLVQDALLAALRARGQFEGRSSQRTWLVSILRRKIIDHFRKVGRRGEVDSTDVGLGDMFDEQGHWHDAPGRWPKDPARVAEDKEFHEAFEKCLGKLPATLNETFTLREFECLESAEICDALSISTSNLWTRLHRARLLIRRCLELTWFGK